jgi:hypothetical protein
VVRRVLLWGTALLGGAIVVWWSWPRPALEIRVTAGGVARVFDYLGRESALGDTVLVRGSGGHRTIRVVNRDTVPHRLAMFAAAPGETRDYSVPIGVFGGFCSAHAASQHLTVVVR